MAALYSEGERKKWPPKMAARYNEGRRKEQKSGSYLPAGAYVTSRLNDTEGTLTPLIAFTWQHPSNPPRNSQMCRA